MTARATAPNRDNPNWREIEYSRDGDRLPKPGQPVETWNPGNYRAMAAKMGEYHWDADADAFWRLAAHLEAQLDK